MSRPSFVEVADAVAHKVATRFFGERHQLRGCVDLQPLDRRESVGAQSLDIERGQCGDASTETSPPAYMRERPGYREARIACRCPSPALSLVIRCDVVLAFEHTSWNAEHHRNCKLSFRKTAPRAETQMGRYTWPIDFAPALGFCCALAAIGRTMAG
jgi:hypothetical protein